MQIRQLALNYRPEPDRLLLRVNSDDGQQFAVWLTRRLSARLWPHLARIVTTIGVTRQVAAASPGATVMPEARAMLAQSARERALRGADFSTPFNDQARGHPLGREPLLAIEVQLTPMPDGQLRLTIIDTQKRQVQLQLTEDLATAVKELMHAALRQADWGLAVDAAAPADPDAAQAPRVLN